MVALFWGKKSPEATAKKTRRAVQMFVGRGGPFVFFKALFKHLLVIVGSLRGVLGEQRDKNSFPERILMIVECVCHFRGRSGTQTGVMLDRFRIVFLFVATPVM